MDGNLRAFPHLLYDTRQPTTILPAHSALVRPPSDCCPGPLPYSIGQSSTSSSKVIPNADATPRFPLGIDPSSSSSHRSSKTAFGLAPLWQPLGAYSKQTLVGGEIPSFFSSQQWRVTQPWFFSQSPDVLHGLRPLQSLSRTHICWSLESAPLRQAQRSFFFFSFPGSHGKVLILLRGSGRPSCRRR